MPARIGASRPKLLGSGTAAAGFGDSVADQVVVTVPPSASHLKKVVIFAAAPEQAPVPDMVPANCVEKSP